MPALLSKSLPLSTNFTMDEEAKASEKQGIVSILGCDCQRSSSTSSLRRTLSADMSSKKWLAQNGFSTVKKTASSLELLGSISDSSSSSSDDEEEDYEDGKDSRFEIWNSIQEAKKNNPEESAQKSVDFISWGSILTQKRDEGSKSLPPPYVHPLMKRSASTLSQKSLEICTESLGSETGSDGFSAYPSSEDGDVEDRQERSITVRNTFLVSKKYSQPRSFPPPLPSLSRENGASVSMRSRRDNGRLVLEAVSVSSQNNFQAQRKGGRLILTLVNHTREVETEEAEEENQFVTELDEESVAFEGTPVNNEGGKEEESEEGHDDAEDDRLGSKKVEFFMDHAPKMPGGVINVHKLALLMNKHKGLPNSNQAWQNKKFNEVVKYQEEEEEVSLNSIPLQQSSLPLQPRVTGTNVYEYFWRTKPAMNPVSANLISQQPLSLKDYSNKCIITKNSVPNDMQESKAMLRGSKTAFYLAPLVKSCNEPRRALSFWEQSCIATS